MRLLLDTHAFLWFAQASPQLSEIARDAIASPTNELLLSPASYWEIAIKLRLGKYRLKIPFCEFVDQSLDYYQMGILNIRPAHAAVIAELPFHHRDPFDRMVIAQVLVENVAVVSADEIFDAYGIERVW